MWSQPSVEVFGISVENISTMKAKYNKMLIYNNAHNETLIISLIGRNINIVQLLLRILRMDMDTTFVHTRLSVICAKLININLVHWVPNRNFLQTYQNQFVSDNIWPFTNCVPNNFGTVATDRNSWTGSKWHCHEYKVDNKWGLWTNCTFGGIIQAKYTVNPFNLPPASCLDCFFDCYISLFVILICVAMQSYFTSVIFLNISFLELFCS